MNNRIEEQFQETVSRYISKLEDYIDNAYKNNITDQYGIQAAKKALGTFVNETRDLWSRYLFEQDRVELDEIIRDMKKIIEECTLSPLY